ncbi:hypothetical protein [Arthrobacter sp. zg-Y1110]|uniref:hypothetical protein n=1 Tax=Arthrobacter sp. zg-Y1110 TaxID=2886932 RepID=UPI001D14C7E1|nr:hypothetical protein [Arthrobacter sp. zg-Y1110]MCC3292993.1 hypothetical protein [Arthrobacter sp. zg-Y1110]UWX86932.1 hypothetical protein N2K99_18990 [Arthrobacter sp. zg-Y1110]
MTTHINRQPEGIPAGGQFATTIRSEAAGVTLADSTDRPIVLTQGEDEMYPELAEESVMDRLTVSRDDEDPDKYFVHAEREVNFHALVEREQPDLTEEEREAWLNRHQLVIEDFMTERYEAETHGDDWSSITAECSAVIRDANPTEGKVSDAAWNETKIVNLANEEDPGTFGSENLSRLLHERVEATASVGDFWAAKRKADSMDPVTVDGITELRFGERELPDDAALAIAYDMGMSGPYPTMAKLARTGFADKEELRNDLRKIYERDQHSPKASRRANMMFTWIEQGGDNN